jgi:hypothetical protein
VAFEPLELIDRLAALVPPPRFHTVRYHGVLASRSKYRAQVVRVRSSPHDVDPMRPSASSIRRTPPPNGGIVDWLLGCPEKGFFVPVESESTDEL